jgi:uncharacterized Zn finger protein
MPRDRWFRFGSHVSAADKRSRAELAIARLARQAGRGGRPPEPVRLEGRRIASTFWGKAWCDNLESYADFAYRLERGRSYVRSGAVVDLEVVGGEVRAQVAGSDLYRIAIAIPPLAPTRWKALARTCGGRIDSMLGLLQGALPDEVMRAVTDRTGGLFPEPGQMDLTCSCPDRATVCKHVAASLYGVGARLDTRPELLFQLRGVDPQDLIEEGARALGTAGEATAETLAGDTSDLAALFGIDLVDGAPPPRRRRRR